MSMIFKFRMLSDEDENFVRDYEVPGNLSLKKFHEFICEDLEYDEFEMASFFLSDESWQKLEEFTLEDMGMDEQESLLTPVMLMENAILEQIITSENDRLLYVFDIYEDRAFFLKVTDAVSDDSALVPFVRFAHGTPPDQFDASGATKNESIFDEAMDDWGDFSGDDNYDDEY